MAKMKGIIFIVLGVIAVLLLGIMAFGGLLEEAIPGFEPAVGDVDCNVNPSLTIAAVNALNKGTSVTVNSEYQVNGKYVSSYSAPIKGDKVVVLVNATNYLDTILPEVTIGCGPNNVNAEVYATGANVYRIKNDDGDFMTDAVTAGTTNQTDIAAGEKLILDVEFSGTDKESTGDMIFIIEVSTSVNVSSITLGGLTSVSVPAAYVATTAGSEVAAFRVPAIVGADKKTYSLTIQSATGKDVSGAVYTEYRSEQAFKQPNGDFAVGVEDSDKTVKYEDLQDFDFYIDAA